MCVHMCVYVCVCVYGHMIKPLGSCEHTLHILGQCRDRYMALPYTGMESWQQQNTVNVDTVPINFSSKQP